MRIYPYSSVFALPIRPSNRFQFQMNIVGKEPRRRGISLLLFQYNLPNCSCLKLPKIESYEMLSIGKNKILNINETCLIKYRTNDIWNE